MIPSSFRSRGKNVIDLLQCYGCNMEVMLNSWLSQAVEWLTELLDALLKTHIRLGDDAQETKVLLEKHRKFVDVAQVIRQIGEERPHSIVVIIWNVRVVYKGILNRISLMFEYLFQFYEIFCLYFPLCITYFILNKY